MTIMWLMGKANF